MFKRILVPLDGSPRAERALPVAARIARASGGSVVLLQVVGLPFAYETYLSGLYLAQTPVFAQDILDTEFERANQYLANVAQSEQFVGIKTETEVFSGLAAPTIIDTASVEHVDLVVMCSHGNTGLKRWVLGSVAQKMARHSSAPILVLREDGSAPTSSYPDPLHPLRTLMALVALDGSELAETALAPAAHLVAALVAPAHGTLLLTRVVKRPAIGSEQSYQKQVDSRVNEAEAYLSRVANDLCEGPLGELDLAVSSAVAVGGNVADTLIKVAEDGKTVNGGQMFCNCDLMVMATHGRGGIERLAMGSVTEIVLGATKLPLLIVRPSVGALSEARGAPFKSFAPQAAESEVVEREKVEG